MCPREQVCGLDAGWIVATMTDEDRRFEPRFDPKLVGEPVSEHNLLSVPNSPIAVRITSTLPLKAAVIDPDASQLQLLAYVLRTH